MKRFLLLGLFLGTFSLAQENAAVENSPTVSANTEVAPRHRRWGLSPHLGLANIVTHVSGHKMMLALSLGLRSTFDLSKYFAMGLQVNADFIHSSYDEDNGQGKLNISSVTPLFVMEARIPSINLYFGPVVGFSQKSYDLSAETHFFSSSEKGGCDTLLVYGGQVGWNFAVGSRKRIVMGPRVDFYHYSATHTDYVSSHSALNTYFTTKFMF